MIALTVNIHVTEPVHLHVHGEASPELLGRLTALDSGLSTIGGFMSALTVAFDRLKAEVAEAKTVADSAKALIANLAQQIRDNAMDPKALTDLADALDASDADLAKAVTDNTSTAVPPPTTGDEV